MSDKILPFEENNLQDSSRKIIFFIKEIWFLTF